MHDRRIHIEDAGEAQRDDPANPAHYTQYAIQPIDFIMRNNLPFWMANVIKYVLRADRKAGIEDLQKAQKYIEFRIRQLKGEAITDADYKRMLKTHLDHK